MILLSKLVLKKDGFMENGSDCIIMNKVNKYFGEKQVLKDVSMSVPYGCIYGLLGPSGCGKTTSVKIMAGISESTSGETYVLGRKMPQLSLMNEIGYMAQSDALYMMLSAADNLEFFAAIYGMKKEQYKKRILEVMELVNLAEDLNKPVAAYSGGMKRRLSLAMAILHNPKVLILDEPTVGIDPLLRQDIWKELYQMSDNGVTILVTTHVMDEALKCHQLAMMRRGVMIAQGTPKELQDNIGAASIEEAFIHYGGGSHED
jgi:ABC-2 type transport system ATP-binding protein